MYKNRRKNFLSLLLILVIGVGIGYAFLSSNLKINGGSGISKGSWIIYFDKIENESGVISPNTTISEDKQTIDFDISIKKPGDYYEFDVDTVNDGTIDAMIDSIQVEGLDSTYKKLMSFDVVYKDTKTTLHKCDLLPKKSRKTVTVKVKYTEDITEEDLLEQSENINLKFKINYVQGGECSRNPLLTVDPNGGTYKGLRSVQDEEVEPNSTVTVEAPKYTGRNFKGYELEDGTLLEKENDGTTLVEVEENDVVIKAIWDRKDYIARIIDNNTYYETLQDAINESLDGQTVELLRSTTEDPENNKNITIDLGTNTVNGTFTNDNGYTLTLKNGTVKSDTVAFINNGTLNLGIKDGNYEEENIILRGEQKGLQQNGTFNFYDGYIIGKLGLIGGHNDKEVDYYVYVENNTAKNYQKVYLTKNTTRAVVMTRYNGEVYYNNLQNAIDVTTLDSVNDQEENGYTMYAVRSFEAAYKNTLNQDDVVTLDLNGFDVETGYTVINNGNFTITDSVSGGSFIPSIPIENNNTLNVKDTLLKSSTNANIIENNETLTITNSTITSKGGYSVVNKGAGTVSIDKDTVIDGDNYNFKNTSSTPLTFTEGTIYNLENSGTITLKEDVLVTSSTQEYAIKNEGTINLEGGEVTGYNGINNINILNVKSGTITTNNNGILNSGTLELTGGEIVSSNTGIETRATLTGMKIDITAPTGIRNYGTTTLSDDVNITSTSACIDSRGTTTVNGGSYIGSGYSVSCTGGNTTLNSGTFKSTTTTALKQTNGTLNLNGGTVESPTNGVYTNYATFNMEGGTISSPTGVTGSGTYYEGNAYINIKGGTINSTETGVLADKNRAYFTITGGTINATNSNGIGVKNSNSDDLSSTTITGGTINAGKYGVYNSHAPLTIGTNGEEILETPVIKGELFGVYVDSGIVKFYDGLLKGITDGHYGEIEETPTNSAVYEKTETISSKTYNVHYVKVQENWLKVGNQEFNSIDQAAAAINETGTIQVIADANVTYNQTFPEGKNITFDLNGYDVKFGKNVTNNGTVEIIDSSNPKTGSIKTINNNGIENNGTLTLNEFSLITNGEYGLKNTGTLTLQSLDVETTSKYTLYNEGGEVTINSTDIETEEVVIQNVYSYPTSGTITVNNSKLTSTTKYPIEVNYGRVALNETEVAGHTYGAKVTNGTLELNSGSIDGIEAGVYGSGNYVQNGGEVTSDTIGVESTGTVTINGGKIEAPTAITMLCDDYYTAVTHPVLVTGGEVIGTENEAIKIEKSVVRVTGGTVISEQSNAIYAEGYVEIGDNSNEIKEVPTIQGYEYAIYDKDIDYYTKFFDGVLKGRTGTNNGLIDEIPDASIIQESEETISGDLYQIKTITEFGNFLRVNGVEYNSFKKASAAIDAYENDEGESLLNQAEGTIEVIADAYVNFEAVLPKHKKITLDLRGHTLVMTQPLETKGINRIVDSSNSQNGLLRNIYTHAVENTGNLTIEGGSYKSEETYALDVIRGTTTLEGGNFTYKKTIEVKNNANLVVNNTYVNVEDENGIYNYEGTTTINGGTIYSKNKPAIDSTRGTLIINDGNISSKNDYAVSSIGFSLNITGGNLHSEKESALYVYHDTATISGGNFISDEKNGAFIDSSHYGQTSITISGGEFTGKLDGIIFNDSYTEFNISGGRMIGENNGINNRNARGTISNVYAEGNVNGINHTGGTLTMIGGTAVGNTRHGLYSSSNLTLGTQDRNVDISSPLLIGELYGLYSEGSTDFYDGILKGKTYGYTGKFANIEVATQIWNDTETIDDVLYKTTYLIEERDIAENMRTHEKYNNLETALNSTEPSDTVKLINNAPIYYPVTIGNNVDITFDMNGYSISTNKNIVNNGKVEVVNNSETTSSIKTAANINLITTTNEISFDNIKLTNTSTSNYVLTNTGTLTLTNSNIDSIYGVNSNNNLTLTNTNISSTSTTINNSGQLTINGGEYSGSTVVYSSTNKDVSIKNTKLLGTNTSLYSSSSNNDVEIDNVIMNGNLTTSGSASTATINALTLTGNYSNSSNTTMTSSSITSTLKGYYSDQDSYFVTNSKKLDMDTVTLNLTTVNQGNFYGIYLSGNGTSEISNLTLNSSGEGNIYGIYLQDNNNNVVLTDGTVDVSGTNAYGVYINRGEFVLGISDSEKEKEDKVISTTNPLIKAVGTTKGIGVKKNDAYFKYYDGKLIGSTQSKPDTTTVVEEGYEASIYMDSTTGYEYCILENLEDGYTAVARMNGVYYNTIQEAINNSKTGSVITLLKNTIENVENTKNVVIDLNNHRISGKYFNRGTTRFINGSLYNTSETTVQNTGTLILGEEDGEVSTTSVGILNENYISINQLGRLIIYDGYVQGKVAINGAVTLTERGYAVKTEQTKEIDPDTEEEIVTYEKAYLISQSQMDDDEEKPTYSFMVTIDPNGGLYKGTSDIEENFLMQGETLEITDEPTREGYTFDHWEEVSETNAFENGVVTVTDSNVELKAIWNVTDQVVAKVGDNYYVTLNKAYQAAINGDKIELIKDVTENLTNDKTITLDLGGHKVTGTITNNGTLNLDNGRVENTTNTPIVNNGTLNMGVDEGQMSTSSPIIFGGDYGIEQNGVFNFYDGTVYGQKAIEGSYNKGAAGYYLYVDRDIDNDCQKVYLIRNSSEAVARVVIGGDYFFNSLQDAIRATDNLHPTVYLLANIESSYQITVNNGQKLEIDLDGHILTYGSTITNNGELSLVDSGNLTKGKIVLSNSIKNSGDLTLDNIVINTSSNSANLIDNNGDIEINKSTLTAINGYVLNNSTAGEIELDNETVLTSSNYAINNTTDGEVIITGGTIVGVQNTGSNLKLVNNTITNPSGKYSITTSGSSLTLEGTDVSGNSYSLYNNGSTVTINSGTFTSSGSNTIYSNSGTLNINGGTIGNTTSEYTTVYIDKGSCNITGGTFEVTGTSSTLGAFKTNYGTTSTITGGTFTSQNNGTAGIVNAGNITISNITTTGNRGYGLWVTGGTVNVSDTNIESTSGSALYITGGTTTIPDGVNIKSTSGNGISKDGGTLNITGGNISSNSSKGVYIYGGTNTITGGTIKGGSYGLHHSGGTITLGTNDSTVGKTTPEIIGETYGYYYSSGTFNFYDGILLGNTAGMSGSPTNIPRRYDITTGEKSIVDEETQITTVYKSAYLDEKVDFLQVRSNTYNDLQDAIDAAGTEGTIKVIKDASVGEDTSILSTQNVTLDLNNHALTMNRTITNNGTLTVDDNSNDKGGSITTNSVILFENPGSITINKGTFTTRNHFIRSYNGNVTVTGGTINSNSNNSDIYVSNGTANISNMVINTQGYASLKFVSGTTATVDGVTITGTNYAYGIYNDGATITVNDANITTISGYSIYQTGGTNTIKDGTYTTSYNNTIYTSNGTLILEKGTYSNTGSYELIETHSTDVRIDDGTYTANGDSFLFFVGGTATVNDGTYTTSNGSGIFNRNATVTINGGEFTTTKSNYSGLYNESGTVTINDGTFTGEKSGAENRGTMTVTNGEFNSSNYGIYQYNGTLTLGTKDGNITQIPELKGNQYGLYVENGTTNFYDGILKGKTKGYNGSISSIEDKYMISEGVDGEYKTAFLEVQANFIKVGNEEFNSVQDAIDAISTTGTMTLIANGTDSIEATIPSTKTITFDLNGKDLTLTKKITNNGNLTIVDNSNNKDGSLTNRSTIMFESPGIITVNDGTFNTSKHFIKSIEGTVTMTGGTINSDSSNADVYVSNGTANITNTVFNSAGYASLMFESGAIATIEDITITDTDSAIGVYNNGATVTINDANIQTASGQTIYQNTGTTTIKDGTYSTTVVETICTSGGTLILENGTYTNTGNAELIETHSTTVTVDDGNYTATGANFLFFTGGTATVNDGTYTTSNGSGIFNRNATVTINGGTFTATGNSSTAVYNEGGTITINDGTFIGKNHGAENRATLNIKGGQINGENYGVYQNGGTLTLGTKDSTISTSIPTIIGNTYGLYVNSGTVNFYDGILKGKTKGYTGIISNIEEDSFINEEDQIVDENTTYKVAYLIGQTEIIQNDATKVKFTNIQTAITEAASGEKLVMLDNASVYYTITVPDKEIILDLAGYKITTNKTITNNGMLSIIDSSNSKTGEIKSTAAINLIANNQVLTINDTELSITSNAYYMISNNSNATLTINRATLNAPYTLYNYNNATINNSNITGNYGIRNENSAGSLTLSNTNITTTNWCIYNYNSHYSIDGGELTATNDYVIYSNGSNTNESIITNEAVLTKNSGNVIDSNSLMKLKIEDSTIIGNIYNNNSTIEFDTVEYTGKIDNRGTINIDKSNIIYNDSSYSNLEVIYNTNKININDSTLTFVRNVDTNYNFVGLNNNAGTVNIENTDISVSISNSNYGTLYGINNNGTFTYKKGTINVGASNTNYGIYNVSTNSTLAPTSITVGAATNSYGIYNAGGTTILKKGSVLVENSETSYGVYQNAGTVTLGTYDGSGLAAADVSITNPEIRAVGTTTGIGYKKSDGTFNYYDGRIVGSTSAKPEAPSSIEPNYQVVNYTENDTSYPYCILECLTPDDGSIDYDWRVNVDDENSVYTKNITTDNLVWKDSQGNTYSEPAEGRFAEYRISIFQSEISKNFSYNVEVTLGNGVPITVTQNNAAGIFTLSDTLYEKDKVTFTADNIIDYSNMDKSITLKVTTSSNLADSQEYSFEGKEETFVAPKSGIYLLETWGAQGGDANNYHGGYGGYSTGKVYLNEGDTLYINVGGKGGTNPRTIETVAGGYNGGGSSYRNNNGDGEGSYRGSGGGATSIATKSGLLSTLQDSRDSILIVSGGGGGASSWSNHYGIAGSGGGIEGTDGQLVYGDGTAGTGATQTAGGNFGGQFGQGGNAIAEPGWGQSGGPGGGGGYYGGSYGKNNAGAGGGSGYIGNELLSDKHMVCYNCETSNEESTLTLSNDNVSETPLVDTAKSGDGYAKITFIEDFEKEFDYTGGPQTFVAPMSGIYNVQAWGAQGGESLCDGNKCVDGGLGAYTSGNIYLSAGTKLYIYVGGKGADAVVRQNSLGGYNGGGLGTWDNSDDESAGAGGGATDIRLVGGTWNDNTSLASRIMIAGAGGGAAWNNVGGAGGGLIATSTYEGLHATQTSGFSFGIGRNGEGVGASDGVAGGGSGYYGGYSGTYPEINNDYGLYDYGSGGTSYISGHTGSVAIKSSSDTSPRLDSNNNICADGTVDYKCSIHYSKMKFENTVMIDGQGYNWSTEKGSYIGQTQPDGTTTTGHTGNGYAKIKLIEKVNVSEFDYTGAEQTFTAPDSGYYKLETWGAQGGWDGGYGGYSSGKIFLNKGDVLYVNVGGAGQGDGTHQTVAGGYNGGGDAIADEDGNTRQGSGGGATHIAKKSGLLSQLESYKGTLSSGEDYYVSDDIIIVAGGGGGRSNNAVLWSGLAGGNGGGYIGGDGESVVYYSYIFHGFGGTQTIGGVNSGDVSNYNEGSFGKGASGAVAGGGGGFFGGGNAYYSGGGGSGYIANPNLTGKHMTCYNCATSSDTSTKTISNTNVSETPTADYSKIGNGFARITLIDENTSNDVYYSNGVSYENLYTENTWQTETAQFLSDSIYLPTKTYGYYIVYTDTIDLSKYNTVIVRKTNFDSNRVGFLKYPDRVNNEEVKYVPTWTNISNTDIYLGDISNDTRNDLKFYISDWEGANSGYVYYISFSTKTQSEILENYNFIYE